MKRKVVILMIFFGLVSLLFYLFEFHLVFQVFLQKEDHEKLLQEETPNPREGEECLQEEKTNFFWQLNLLQQQYENTTEDLSFEDWQLLTQLKHNFTTLWKQRQWDYKGHEDETEEYLLWRSFYGLSPKEKKSVDETYQNLASKYPCENNIWCDTWYPLSETTATQEMIWKHQHPADCQNSRILYWIQEPTGIGAMIHNIGVGLTHALNTNRVLVLEDPMSYVDDEHCGGLGAMGCFFLPVSNCTRNNAILPIDGVVRDPDLNTEYHFTDPQHNDKRVLTATNWDDHFFCQYGTVPSQFAHKGLYWWRSQLTTYVARPRISLAKYVERQKKIIFHKYGGKVPHPIMCIHVRHGDKWVEANLHDLPEYMDLARLIEKKYGISRIFLSTEDPEVISEAVENYSEEFEIFYHDIPRLNTDPFSSQRALGPAAESLISYTTYLVSLECDAFIGQRESSFCRFIDEGRKSIGKARIPYFDVGPKQYEPRGWFKLPDEPEELEVYLTVCQPTGIEQQPTEFDSNLVEPAHEKRAIG